jgi:predicted dehydrogenase
MTPLRFGLLGTGYWALHAHGAALRASPEAVLEGVWGRDPAKTADIARQLGAKSYDDLGELFTAVDAVALALPPDVQSELAVRAARAGCHLLLEKPLALDVAGAAAVAKAVDEAGVASVVFFTQRFNPASESWVAKAAEAGPWHSAHLVHYANIIEPGNPFGSSPWRRERGALWDIGPHALAAILPLMGKVTSVAARRGPAGSDTVHLVLEHGRAQVGSLPSSPVAFGAVPGSPVHVGGANDGPVSASTVSLSLTMPSVATGTRLALYGNAGVWERPQAAFEVSEAMLVAISELAAMASSGARRHRCDVHFGLEVVSVLAAAEQALALPAVDLS